jgi:hypothetical protein
MDKNFFVFLVLIAGIGGYYSYLIFGMLIAIIFMDMVKKKEVKQEKWHY